MSQAKKDEEGDKKRETKKRETKKREAKRGRGEKRERQKQRQRQRARPARPPDALQACQAALYRAGRSLSGVINLKRKRGEGPGTPIYMGLYPPDALQVGLDSRPVALQPPRQRANVVEVGQPAHLLAHPARHAARGGGERRAGEWAGGRVGGWVGWGAGSEAAAEAAAPANDTLDPSSAAAAANERPTRASSPPQPPIRPPAPPPAHPPALRVEPRGGKAVPAGHHGRLQPRLGLQHHLQQWGANREQMGNLGIWQIEEGPDLASSTICSGGAWHVVTHLAEEHQLGLQHLQQGQATQGQMESC